MYELWTGCPNLGHTTLVRLKSKIYIPSTLNRLYLSEGGDWKEQEEEKKEEERNRGPKQPCYTLV